MSQQCLPLPKNTKETPVNNNDISGKLEISNLQNMDALTYLGMVHNEASLLPDTFYSDIPNTHTSKKHKNNFMAIEGTQVCADILISKRMDLTPCTDIKLLPTRKWIQTQLDNFERLREYLDVCGDEGNIGKNRDVRLPVPRMKDREGWHEFCLGKSEASGNINNYFDDDDDDDDSMDSSSSTTPPPWRNNLPENGYKPTVSLILQLDENMTRTVVAHLTYFVSLNWPITLKRSQWIYSLLAHVHHPLHSDDQAVFRLLLRLCTKARAKITIDGGDDSILACINLLIVILAFYFQQGDGSVMEVV